MLNMFTIIKCNLHLFRNRKHLFSYWIGLYERVKTTHMGDLQLCKLFMNHARLALGRKVVMCKSNVIVW